MPARSTARRGFSLIELVVSLGVSTVLLLSMGSVMVLAARAVPETDNRAARAIEAARALELIADDLAYADRIAVSSGVACEVADRTGDGNPETVRFGIVDGTSTLAAKWSDVATGATVLVEGVASFDVKLEEADGAAVAAEMVLTLLDMPDEPFRRRVALLNRPGRS
ncbi:MAG: prepilin-type N-terminal cleavage/methylation domain-containing protein [Phycisphaerales bacterium]